MKWLTLHRTGGAIRTRLFSLGAVWMGIAPDQKRMDAVRNVLHLPQNLHAFALVPCGYPAEERAQEDRFDVNRVHYIG